GLPAVRLAPLRRLERLARLTDEEMVNVQRCNLLDAAAPNPSVETLFHAFLPQRFIDHTHANAILALTDQPDGEARAPDPFGARAPVLAYVRPGFALAKAAAAAARAHQDAEGLVLSRHGLFTWGDSAQEAYERMIALVSRAEAALAHNASSVFVAAPLPQRVA